MSDMPVYYYADEAWTDVLDGLDGETDAECIERLCRKLGETDES